MTHVELTLKVTFEPELTPGRMVADVVFENQDTSELLVLDRLWTEGPEANSWRWDPEVAYRFVLDRSLLLFFGLAPRPENMLVHENFFPHATRLAPGRRLTHRIVLEFPIKEYSVLFVEESRPGAPPPYAPVCVDSVEVIMQYALVADCLHTKPSFIDPEAVYLGSYPMVMRSARASVSVPPFEVLRRTDFFERPTRPDDRLPRT